MAVESEQGDDYVPIRAYISYDSNACNECEQGKSMLCMFVVPFYYIRLCMVADNLFDPIVIRSPQFEQDMPYCDQ